MVREERAGTVGLKARDSQREEDPERQRRVKDSSDIHLVLQYLSLTWTDSVSAERSELDHSLYTHTHTLEVCGTEAEKKRTKGRSRCR